MSIKQIIADRYQILAPIGEGGMALVFLARDLRTGHDVAIKFLRPEYKQNPDFLSRFQREATDEYGQAHEENLLPWAEQVIAPVNRAAQRLLAGRHVA